MASHIFGQQSPIRQHLPWICTSLAIGYVAYVQWRRRYCSKITNDNRNDDQDHQNDENRIQLNADEKYSKSFNVNIDDDIDRQNTNKNKISYCRCWKSAKFPYCDGAHKRHNRTNDDHIGPLNLTWNTDTHQQQNQSENIKGDSDQQQQLLHPQSTSNNEQPEQQIAPPSSSSIIINEQDIDIKSIDSVDSDQQSITMNGDNGNSNNDDFDVLNKIDDSNRSHQFIN